MIIAHDSAKTYKVSDKGFKSMSQQPARVIAITSGKGGVGKTHTTVNLGLALTQLGKRVLILDADLGLANVNVLLGFRPKSNIHDVLQQKSSIRDVIVSYRESFDIIPATSGVPELTHLADGERMNLLSAIDELATQYDYMLVDTAAGIGQDVMYFNVAAEDILVVVDPEPTSITDAYALIKVLATQHGRDEFNILINRTTQGNDGRGVYAQLARTTDKFLTIRLNFLGSVADDDAVVEAVIAQKPYLELFPTAKSSRDIIKIAKGLIANETPRKAQGGMQFFFNALLNAN